MPFVSGSTPSPTAFGIFDADPVFQVDADLVLKFVARKLGESGVQVELEANDVYTAFEQATLELSKITNMYQAKSALATFLGTPTGSLRGYENTYPQFSLEWARRQAQAYADEAYTGGNKPVHRGHFTVSGTRQDYDLQSLVNPTGSDGSPRRLIIREIYHTNPSAGYRLFGSNSQVNYLANQFRFESYTPETIFYLLPIWEDVLRGQMFETSAMVRRSHYSYELHNNVLTLYPPPMALEGAQVHFTYQIQNELDPLGPTNASGSLLDPMGRGVSNLTNIPFGNIEYGKLNSIARTWIWQMTLAISKEVLGYIRRKMANVPIPNGDLTLDGEQLVADGRAEQEALRQELKDLLDSTTYDKIWAIEQQKAESLAGTMKYIPSKIFIG